MRKIVLLIGFCFAALASLGQEAKLMLPIGHTDKILQATFSIDDKKVLTASADRTAKIWDVQTGKLLVDIKGHSGTVYSASYSPDGKKIVTASYDNTAKIWDAETGKLLIDLRGHTKDNILSRGVTAASFSPDGKKIVTASGDSTAKIWDAETGKLLADLKGHAAGLNSAQFSPDGKKIITIPDRGAVKIWDVATGNFLSDLKEGDFDPTFYEVTMAQFSPDGKRISTVLRDNTVKIWNAETGTVLLNLQRFSGDVNSVNFSPDGKKIVTASRDSTARIWDAGTGNVLADLKGHTNGVNYADFSPDSKKVVTASDDGTAKIWDAGTGKFLANLTGYTAGVCFARFSHDSKTVIINSNDLTSKTWNVASGKLIADLKGHTPIITAAVFSPDGKRIVTAFQDLTVKIWDTEAGKIITELKGFQNPVSHIKFSDDGKKMVTLADDGTVRVWDARSALLIADLNSRESIGFASDLAFSPDGKKILTFNEAALVDGSAEIWDAETGQLLVELKGHKANITIAKFSPDGKKIITASSDNTSKTWDAETGKSLSDLRGCIAVFSPDGQKIVTGSKDSTACIWNAETGTLSANLTDRSGEVNYVQFSPDGEKVVITSADSVTKVWDVKTGNLLAELKGSARTRNGGLFSADGKRIVTVYGGSAKIWDAKTGKLLASLDGQASSVDFFSDDKRIVTVSLQGVVKVWDAETQKFIATLQEHTDNFTKAETASGRRPKDLTRADTDDYKDNYGQPPQLSPDGKKILTILSDNTCKIWRAETGKLLYTFFAVDSSDYLVVDQNRRYDGTGGARKLLYFTCGTEVIGLDQVKDQLWVPNLAERIMKGDSINAKKLSDLDICGLIPRVEKEDKTGYHFIITPQRGGLGETVVYVNGIEERRYKSSQLTKIATGYELNPNEQELAPYFISGQENPVTVKAYTANNDISSRGAEIIQDETKKKGLAPNLYAVMIGVSDYKGPELQLKYAAKDAEDISAAISASAKKLLDTTGGEEHVFMYNLTTGKNHYELPEKIAIKNVFGEIGKKATANDILLIFFAGHGVTSGEKKQFYFLTADASQASATDAPAEVGISTKELGEWMQPSNIKAQKRILILDACNSGQAINELVKVGADGQNYLAARNDDKAEQIKAIDKLNEKSGLFILAASASNQSAYEMGRYSQGLLTYSLLKAIKQQPDILEDNKYLNVSRWFNAAEKTVSDMVRETGNRQEPQIVSAGNFNIGVVDREVMAGIKLADEKPLFTASNFQNSDPDIMIDNLHFNSLLDNQLNEISARSDDNGISYVPGSNSPDAYSLGGRYTVNGVEVTVKIIIRQNDVTKYKFELTGGKDDLKALAEKVVGMATDWIVKPK